MKTSIVDCVLVLLAFNIYRITAFVFAVFLILAVLCYSFFDQIPLIINYAFGLSLGLFVFSLVIRRANVFLEKKYEEKNDYYLDLLDKRKKYISNKLIVVYRKNKG